ncbi:MAG: ABC transporter substrate-binding protein, partial [Pirellulaceae bacterium]
GDYGTAFRTLAFLDAQPGFGRRARISQMMDRCLYEDGEENLQNGQFGEALSAFEELYKRSPRYPVRGSGAVIDRITQCVDQFIEQKVNAGEYEAARQILSRLQTEYGADVNDVVTRWNNEMQDRAEKRLEQADSDLRSGDGDAAHLAARQVLYIMPDLPAATETFNQVIDQYPHIFVGVSQASNSQDIRRIEDWAARRVGSLVHRWLMEYNGPGDEGGKYRFPNGSFERIDELGLKFRLRLNPSNLQNGLPPLKSYEVSNRLFDLADMSSDEHYIPWTRILESIEIEDERSVVFTLRKPHVKPEALLPMPYFTQSDPRSSEFFGRYEPVASSETESAYEFNSRFTKQDNAVFPRIIERLYSNASEATDALLRGELDVVDRVYPGDINRLKRHPMINVRPYLVPTVHMLIPNPRNDFMQSDHFRRALHFGINRELIVGELIAGGGDYNGFQVVSGPFPPGTDDANQLAYAYDPEVKPREFSAKLSLVLSTQYIREEEIRRERDGEANPQVEQPKLVLVHPANDTIAAACNAIAQQWRAIGIPTEVRTLPPGVIVPEDDDYDLLYAEIQMQEPLVDAYRLFGREGLARISDPTIEQALRDLDSAYSWAKVSDALRRVHQQAANNLTILPLWQIVDHYAYRKNVFNTGSDLIYLYENIDSWRLGPLDPPVVDAQE